MADAPSLLVAQPVFLSSDLARTELFYTAQLGFTVNKRHQDWLKLERDAVTLHFSLDPTVNPAKNTCHVYIRTRGIDALYEQCSRNVIHPNGALRTQDYGMREFAAIDPDGNLLTFGEPIVPQR